MKYLILRDRNNQEMPVIFPDHWHHRDTAIAIKGGYNIIGGGTFRIDRGRVHCEGRADGLGLEAMPGDDLLIGQFLGLKEYGEDADEAA